MKHAEFHEVMVAWLALGGELRTRVDAQGQRYMQALWREGPRGAGMIEIAFKERGNPEALRALVVSAALASELFVEGVTLIPMELVESKVDYWSKRGAEAFGFDHQRERVEEELAELLLELIRVKRVPARDRDYDKVHAEAFDVELVLRHLIRNTAFQRWPMRHRALDRFAEQVIAREQANEATEPRGSVDGRDKEP